jgi:23S rRNA (guanosine2251-2'-O)-methyltransferase
VSSFPERNDRKRRRKGGKSQAQTGDGAVWIWGAHAVAAALQNPVRGAPKRLVASPDRARALVSAEILNSAEISRLLPQGAVHQGIAAKFADLQPLALDALGEAPAGFIVMLDQVTDPQNVGAIFRSAAAFGARGIILQERHAPPLSGALAKAAAGAVDRLPHARVVNLSRALERLADLGWRSVGLDGAAADRLDQALDQRPTVLVLGSEGEGLRRLVSELCDALASIPMPGGLESLNVAAAAAVALYQAARSRAARDV